MMAANPQPNDLHGIPMTEEAFERLINGESPYLYELIDGVVFFNRTFARSSCPNSSGKIVWCVAAENRFQ